MNAYQCIIDYLMVTYTLYSLETTKSQLANGKLGNVREKINIKQTNKETHTKDKMKSESWQNLHIT